LSAVTLTDMQLTADDLVIIDDDGLYHTKASVLQQIKRDGPRPPARNISDLHLQVNGDIGIISYHVDKEDRIGNQSIKSETRDLDIYERRSGKWILISRAIVPLPYPNRAPAIVDSSVYGSYVGVYDFGDNFLVTVKTEGDKLLIFNSEDKTPQRLLPFSNISFYLDKSSGVLTFVRDTKGKVLALEIWDSNSTIRGQKIN
jgi:ketosteroid isomerase-like protein